MTQACWVSHLAAVMLRVLLLLLLWCILARGVKPDGWVSPLAAGAPPPRVLHGRGRAKLVGWASYLAAAVEAAAAHEGTGPQLPAWLLLAGLQQPVAHNEAQQAPEQLVKAQPGGIWRGTSRSKCAFSVHVASVYTLY